jgi:predicted nucleic acid-binding protein
VYLLDSNVYLRAFRELAFGRELQEFHQRELRRLVVSAVVVSDVLVGAQSARRERTGHRTLVEPFRARRRFVVPGWSTWMRATAIDLYEATSCQLSARRAARTSWGRPQE